MVAFDSDRLRQYLQEHRLRELFVGELGWDRRGGEFVIAVDGDRFVVSVIAMKRGFAALQCTVHRAVLANRGLLRRLQRQAVRRFCEHIAVFVSDEPAKQVWQWSTRRANGSSVRHTEHPFSSAKPPENLLRRLDKLRFSLEQESPTLVDAVGRVRDALDVSSEPDLFAKLSSDAKHSGPWVGRTQADDREAFDDFVLLHDRLAKNASQMLVRWVGLEAEDAEQIAMLGLLEAVRRFDPLKGGKFSNYASFWIRQHCQRYGVDAALLIRLPVHIFWPAYKFEYRYQRLLATYGAELDRVIMEESLTEFGLQYDHWQTVVAVKEAKNFSDLTPEELDQIRAIPTTDRAYLEDLIDEEMIQATLEEISDLRPRDCQIMGARYGLGHDSMTLKECGETVGITRERVRQIQAKGEEKLRHALRIKFP